MDAEVLGGLLTLMFTIGVFARPVVGKLLTNSKKGENGKKTENSKGDERGIERLEKLLVNDQKSRSKDRGIERLERGMKEGFSGLDKRLNGFEERHRENVKELHQRIDGLNGKFVTKDTCKVARESYQGQGG